MSVHIVWPHGRGGGCRVSSAARRVCGDRIHWRQGAYLRRRDGTRTADTGATWSGGDSSAIFAWRATDTDGFLWSHSRHLGCAHQEVSAPRVTQLVLLPWRLVFLLLPQSCCHQLRGHTAELSNCVWNFSSTLIATGSLDRTARIWDVRRLDQQLHLVSTHSDEVLDVSFDAAGKRLATCSSDCTARVWNLEPLEMLSLMAGHMDEVNKVCFSPSGCMLLTASADNSARLWLTETGQCSQVLSGHESEVFSCAYSYTGDAILTASKDNTCRVWRWYDWYTVQLNSEWTNHLRGRGAFLNN